MSIRAIGARIISHGRALVQNYAKRNINTTAIGDKIIQNKAVIQQATSKPITTSNVVSPRNFALRHVGVQLGLQARRILIDNVLSRVTNSLSADLRKKATRRILFGDSRPFFALVGVSLASGTGILTKEDELEGVCWEIREAISKVKWPYYDINAPLIESASTTDELNLSISDLIVGKPIAKGSNGVVCAANLRSNISSIDDNGLIRCNNHIIGTNYVGENTDSLSISNDGYPYALKMLYNYDITSNSMEILKAMYRETVPAPLYSMDRKEDDWELEMAKRRKKLPPHPNIVAIHAIFTDYVTEFEDCRKLCPAALPSRIHPDGEGRNMSLYILMKRYDCNLQTFLKDNRISIRTSVLLLTQLLEGIAHMVGHGIAHRDLKTDNLLLDVREPESPILVISDFGCCLSDKTHGLTVPYSSWDMDKGGNVALMAPEIYNQQPGTFSVLNYNKADLWAAAMIAYEIFGCHNPAYDLMGSKKSNYDHDNLPKLPEDVPFVVRKLIGNLLQRNPNKRLDAEVAANVCQLFLWAPSSWLKSNTKLPTSAEILQWLLSLTTKLLCESRLQNDEENIPKMQGRRTFPEYLLISSFLLRAKLYNIRSALTWIHEND